MSWYRSDDGPNESNLGNTGTWINKKRNELSPQEANKLSGLDHLRSALDWIQQGRIVTVEVSATGSQHLSIEIPGKGDFRTDFTRLVLNTDCAKLTIRNCTIRDLELNVPSVLFVELIDCFIGKLRFTYPPDRLLIADSWIGTWEVHQSLSSAQNLYRDVEFVRGGLLDVSCPAPYAASPFRGSVSFARTRFSTNRRHLIRGAQPYRNLRAQLAKLENSLAANQVHIAEQVLERQEDSSHFNKAISFSYQGLANFGGSVWRPIGILITAVVLMVGFLCAADGGVPNLDVQEAGGWRASLIGDGWEKVLIRAIVLTLQSTLGPLGGLLGAKSLVIPRTFWLAIVLAPYSILCASLFALFLISLRRRFKMG